MDHQANATPVVPPELETYASDVSEALFDRGQRTRDLSASLMYRDQASSIEMSRDPLKTLSAVMSAMILSGTVSAFLSEIADLPTVRTALEKIGGAG